MTFEKRAAAKNGFLKKRVLKKNTIFFLSAVKNVSHVYFDDASCYHDHNDKCGTYPSGDCNEIGTQIAAAAPSGAGAATAPATTSTPPPPAPTQQQQSR